MLIQNAASGSTFPFLFGGTFIEEKYTLPCHPKEVANFPSFSEGLSLRNAAGIRKDPPTQFPFLFGGTFIEDVQIGLVGIGRNEFPFLFGGTFIEDIDGGDIEFLRTAFPFLFGGTFIEESRRSWGAT